MTSLIGGCPTLLLLLLVVAIATVHADAGSAPYGADIPFQVDSSAERCDLVTQLLIDAQGVDLSASGLTPAQQRRTQTKVLREKFYKMKSRLSRFYRGANALFLHDMLNHHERYTGHVWPFSDATTTTFIGGDMHLQNFGTFHTAHYEDVVYDINDFDDAWISDYTFDVWRLAGGIAINAFEGDYETKRTRRMVQLMSKAYIQSLEKTRTNEFEKNVQFDRKTLSGPLGQFVKKVSKWYANGAAAQKQVLYRYCQYPKHGSREHRVRREWKLQPATAGEARTVRAALPSYQQTTSGLDTGDMGDDYFYVKDVAHRLHQGLSSLGADRLWVVVEGATRSPWDDVILDVKAANAPTWLMFKEKVPAYIVERNELAFDGKSHGQRVTEAQRAMQADVDEHFGWATAGGQSYAVKTRSPYKNRVGHKKIRKGKNMANLAVWWGRIIAKAHARGDNTTVPQWVPWSFEENLLHRLETQRVDGVEYTGVNADPYRANAAMFHHMVVNMAVRYQRQLQSDYKCFVQRYRSGELLRRPKRGGGGAAGGRRVVSSQSAAVATDDVKDEDEDEDDDDEDENEDW